MFGLWTLAKKIFKHRKVFKLVKTALCALADGIISKEEAKNICNDAIDAFMK